MLAAAFPRSAWRAESDAYTMGLMSAGIAPDEASVAVRNLVHESTELPTVADIIIEVRRLHGRRPSPRSVARRADPIVRRSPGCGAALLGLRLGTLPESGG